MSGTSAALESLETSFHQDLNGDGVIGVPGTVIEADWLDQSGRGWQPSSFLIASALDQAPRSNMVARTVVAGQFGRLGTNRRRADGNRL